MLKLFKEAAYASFALAFLNAFSWILFYILATKTLGFSLILVVIAVLAVALSLVVIRFGLTMYATVRQWTGKFDRLKELEANMSRKFHID